jgi:hypothetical protein
MLKYTLPVFFDVTTPFFGAAPDSSPLLLLKHDLFLSMTSLPEIWTLEDPSVVSEEKPVFGYGIGTPGGVAGVCGGVKQTSGKAQIVFPLADLHEISIMLA